MTAYKCDRCGRYFTILGDGEIYSVVSQHSDETWTRHDLCPKCAEAFTKWVTRKQKKLAPELDPKINGGFVFEEVG